MANEWGTRAVEHLKYKINILIGDDEQSEIKMEQPATGDVRTWSFSSAPEDVGEFNAGLGSQLVSSIGREADRKSWSTHDKLEMIGQLIDEVEDFLEEKGVDIRNEEKERDGASYAIIYGSDYGRLSTAFEQILEGWGCVD